MKTIMAGIIMNGVTGRMGTNQHLMRSIVEIIRQGGVILPDGQVVMPEVVLVGRNRDKLKKLSELSGIPQFTTDEQEVMSDPKYDIYFDAQTTGRREIAVREAIRHGKHVYCE
jgi:predicted dehydrogenase